MRFIPLTCASFDTSPELEKLPKAAANQRRCMLGLMHAGWLMAEGGWLGPEASVHLKLRFRPGPGPGPRAGTAPRGREP